MLTDESINLAQNFLHQQFPEFDGLFDTSLALTNTFEVVKRYKPFIQILHTGSLHWVCIGNMKYPRMENNTCHLYDSLNSGTLTATVASQIAALTYCRDKSLKVQIEIVQQQGNYVDCGLYAIAFATSLAFGDNPSSENYNASRLRIHLSDCLEKGIMERFPTLVISRSLRCRKKTASVELFCTCRMPYNPIAKDDAMQDMVRCDKCLEWYHRLCEKIDSDVFETSNHNKWFCSNCCG